MNGDLRQPLLPRSEEEERVGAKEQKNITPDTSLRKLGAVEDGDEVTVTGSEIRAAALTCSSDLSIMNLNNLVPGKQKLAASLENQGVDLLNDVLNRVQALNEEEIKDLLFDHAGLNCCIGNKSPTNWKIQIVEDCNAYVGTLETFVEERTVEDEAEPFDGDCVDSRDKGRMPDAWEMDMKAEMPLLFAPEKEAGRKVPNSEVVKICGECLGCGNLARAPSKAMQFMKCGKGNKSSKGWIRCGWCHGQGALLHRKVLRVRWRTILVKRICATKSAKSVPDEVFGRVRGLRLYQRQSYQCEPARLSSHSLSKLSESVISERSSIPESARIICERHQISLIPVTRILLVNKGKSLKFYILGLSREVFCAEQYSASFFSLCGLCNIC